MIAVLAGIYFSYHFQLDMAGLEYQDELLFDPLYSIQLSIEYLSFLIDRYDDTDWYAG